MHMRYYWLVVGVLVVWRLTYLLQSEDGPWGLSRRLRLAVGASFWGQLLKCFNCLSLWIAAPCAAYLGADLSERLLLWPALSAGAILLLRATERTVVMPSAIYHEEPEDVLRTEPGDLPREKA
jgi:hypothetical protein